MAIVHVTKDNFQELLSSDKPVLLDFYAEWCGPCRMIAPIVEEIANERDDVIVGKINVDEQGELAQAYDVMSIPTLIVLKGGQEVARSTGARPKAQLQAMLEK